MPNIRVGVLEVPFFTNKGMKGTYGIINREANVENPQIILLILWIYFHYIIIGHKNYLNNVEKDEHIMTPGHRNI